MISPLATWPGTPSCSVGVARKPVSGAAARATGTETARAIAAAKTAAMRREECAGSMEGGDLPAGTADPG